LELIDRKMTLPEIAGAAIKAADIGRLRLISNSRPSELGTDKDHIATPAAPGSQRPWQ
jgi:hypothetical protein